jgi:hypothetical protein
MNDVKNRTEHDDLYRRLDEITMSAPERELAKAQMRAAENAVDALSQAVGEIRASAASVKRGIVVWTQRARI